jgi:hypothetical protein
MSSLNTRGGTTIRNRILTAPSEDQECPFLVTVSGDKNQFRALVADGEINYTSFYQKNGGSNEISITPDCEIALMVKFKHNDYEYKKIEEIYAVQYSTENRNNYSTQVADYGNDIYEITMYIPLAYAYKVSENEVEVKQYFCGNVEFRMYYTVLNGAACFEFFKTFAITPGKIPPSQSS